RRPGCATSADRPVRLGGKVVLSPGARRGIGRAIAAEIAGAGADGVVLAARRLPALEAVRDEIGGDVECATVDVTDEESVAALVQRAIDRFGRIDTLVNNVGGASFKVPVADIRADGWHKTVDL